MQIAMAWTALAQPFVGGDKYQTQFAVWPMMFGFCCEFQAQYLRRLPKRFLTLVFRGSILVCCVMGVAHMVARLGSSLVVASGALLLLPCFIAYLEGKTIPGRLGRWFRWLGERTYSIYLWQQPLTLCGFLPPLLYPLGAMLAVGVGGVLFPYFERPFLSSSRRH